MFYEEIILHRCNRTALNGKDHVVIRPTSKTQLILGTNGGGKSSLLEIGFSPLPPDPSDFFPGGYWSVKFHHKGRSYHCTADYGDKNTYTFSVDGGENLNKGKTITVQRELVKQYLNYDKELHNFLLGISKSRFTMMDSRERQKWIAKFSANDFTFAFDRYNHYKRQANAQDKVLKYLRSELSAAKTRLMDADDIAAMRLRAKELHETLDVLIREPKSTNDPIDAFAILSDLDRTIDKIGEWLGTEFPSTEGVSNMTALSQLKIDCETQLNTLLGELNVRSQRLAECESRLERALKSLQYSPEDLEQSLTKYVGQLEALPALTSGLHESLLVPAGQLAVALRQAVSELPSEKRTEGDLIGLRESKAQLEIRANRVSALLDTLTQQADYIHKCEEVECPDCHSKFKPGIKPGELEELRARIIKGEELDREHTTRLAQMEEELSDMVATVHSYQQLDAIRTTFQQSHVGFFAYIDQFGWKDHGKQINEKIAIYERDVKINIERSKLMKTIDNISAALAEARAEVGGLETYRSDYNQAMEAYTSLHEEIQKVKFRKQRIEGAYVKMQQWETVAQDCERAYESIRQDLIRYTNSLGDEMVDDLIRKTKNSLGVLEAALNENDTYEMLAKDLENKITKVAVEKDAFSLIANELCPKTGLIAEQINLQLGGILGSVNHGIDSVWGYSLNISHGDVGENEVDYKFPMSVEGTPRPDISAGSSSIKDIVDQMFRLTGYSAMDLSDYPLYLDELGGTFDPAHRHNLIPFLKGLIDDPRFSQVLMISHSLDGQTAFPGAEIIILDDRNINYPHKYNTHVEFS